MSEQTAIEWADSTFNPWIGCTKVGPGCDHCYAEAMMDTRLGRAQWGAGNPRQRTSAAYWRQPLKWGCERFAACAQCTWRGPYSTFWVGSGENVAGIPLGHTQCPSCGCREYVAARRRVFCASLADVFDNDVDTSWRADLFALMETTPSLDWLVLTKRIGNVRNMVPSAWLQSWPAHVRIGATMVNQDEFNRDIEKLLALDCPNFVSFEPLLGAIDTTRVPTTDPDYPDDGKFFRDVLGRKDWHPDWECGESWLGRRIDWVIAGGESGSHARPVHPDWFRSLRDQCADAGVPFLFKQWGEWAAVSEVEGAGDHFTFDDGATVRKVGKKAAGRFLNGVEHNGFPESSHV